MQLDLSDEGAAALLSLDRRRSLSVVSTYPVAARHSGEVAGCAAGTAAGETADTRRTDARSSATRWPVAALEDMLCAERRHVDDLGVRLSDGCRAPRHSKLSPFGPVTTYPHSG